MKDVTLSINDCIMDDNMTSSFAGAIAATNTICNDDTSVAFDVEIFPWLTIINSTKYRCNWDKLLSTQC